MNKLIIDITLNNITINYDKKYLFFTLNNTNYKMTCDKKIELINNNSIIFSEDENVNLFVNEKKFIHLFNGKLINLKYLLLHNIIKLIDEKEVDLYSTEVKFNDNIETNKVIKNEYIKLVKDIKIIKYDEKDSFIENRLNQLNDFSDEMKNYLKSLL